MTSLTLKNIPTNLLAALRAAAANDRRSVNQQAILLLEQALTERAGGPGRAAVEAQVAAWRALAGQWRSNVDEAAERAEVHARRSGGRPVEL
jgi:hypothetical protein